MEWEIIHISGENKRFGVSLFFAFTLATLRNKSQNKAGEKPLNADFPNNKYLFFETWIIFPRENESIIRKNAL